MELIRRKSGNNDFFGALSGIAVDEPGASGEANLMK